MRELKLLIFLCSITFLNALNAQNVQLEGYVYETGNRGFLNEVSIDVYDTSDRLITSVNSDLSGIFKVDLPIGMDLIIKASKDIFKEKVMAVSTVGKSLDEKLYLKVEMERQPGYIFDVTLAARRNEKEIKQNLPSDAIQGARIEVYNNTKDKQVLDLIDYPNPNFKIHFEDGNHYTIMVRKKGFFTKRMEAYVNVKGCILCFDGVGEVKPGVSDIMTEENTMGTLLANVEMQKVEVGKAIKVENIYYNKNSAKIRDDAAEELDKLITVLKDNPSLIIELSSHTDSRGEDKFNMKLSQRRAEAAVNYITNGSDIEKFRITAKGYGESKLVNRCKDGVECSERRHQKNRRTEIKVTGVLSEDPLKDFSLTRIIQKEKEAKLLEEILNQEVIEVKAGEDLPDEIKKQMEETGKKTKDIKSDSEMQAMHKEEEVEQVIEQVELVSVASKPKVSEVVVDQEIPASTPESVKEVSRPVIKEKISQPTAPVVRPNKKRKTSDAKIASDAGNSNGSRIINELEVNVEYQPSAPQRIESGYTGYMVEFFTSQNELPQSHEIFSKHGKIYKEVKKDGSHAYLFGPFGEWRDANRFLLSAVIGNYESSKVIRYKKGKRMTKN